MPAIIDNPVFAKEFNRRMRERNAFLVPTLYILTMMLVFGASYLLTGEEVQPWALGREIFSDLSVLTILLVALMVPVFSAGAITLEKEQKTLSSLIMTLLSPSSIVAGKLYASAGYVLLVASTSVPVILLAFLFGGIPFSAFILHYLSVAVTAILLASLGLFISVRFHRSMYAIALNAGLLILILTVALFVAAFLSQVQDALKIPILHYLAFLNPLFFLEANSRNQWPFFVLSYLSLSVLLSREASVRLRSQAPTTHT